MMAIGLSQYNVALMHTVNHAFFKALLFLGAGAVIHSFADQQDVRKMGGLIKFLPFTYSVMLTGSLSLLATPYLTGFYSKDLILELAYGQYNFSGIYAYILGSITAGITAFYSFRLISLVFLTTPNGNKQSYINSYLAHHSVASDHRLGETKGKLEKLNLIVILPLLLLALFSIFFGFVFSDLFVGMGSDFFQNSIFMHPKNISLIEAEFSLQSDNNIFIKLLPAIFSFTGALTAIILYHLQLPLGLNFFNLTYNKNKIVASPLGSLATAEPKVSRKKEQDSSTLVAPLAFWQSSAGAGSDGVASDPKSFGARKIAKKIYAFLNGKYYFDVIYNHFIIQNGLNLGYNISKEIDRGAIELLGPYGLSNYFYNAGKNLAKLDTGVITTYSLYITMALISLLFILFSPVLSLATYYLPCPGGSLSLPSFGPADQSVASFGARVINPQSLEEIRLFIIYITSALIVLSPYPPVLAKQVHPKLKL